MADRLNILLVHPEISRTDYNFTGIIENECLELEYISAVLKQRGHHVVLYDGQVESTGVSGAIRKADPALVYVCGRARQENFILEYCAAAKKHDAKTVTVVGGLHAQLCYERMYRGEVDYILKTFDIFKILDLIDHAIFRTGTNIAEIGGICYKDGNEWVSGACEPFDIRRLPRPDRSYFYARPNRYRYLELGHAAWVRTAYSCPYGCKFCIRSKTNCGKYSARDIADVVDEIAELEAENIYIADDDFLIDAARLDRFAELLIRRGIRKNFICYGRADFIAGNRDVMARLKSAGLYYVLTGLESVRESDLERHGKRCRVGDNIACVRLCNELGIRIMGMFILYLDFTAADFRRLYAWIKQQKLRHAAVSIFTPELCTEMFEAYKERIITENPSHWDYLHLVARPSKMGVRRFYFHYYTLLIKLMLRARRGGVYDFIDYKYYLKSFARNIFRPKRENDDE